MTLHAPAHSVETRGNFIDGREVEAGDGTLIDVRNPATGAVIARIQADLTAFTEARGVAVVDLLDDFMDSEVRPYGDVDQSHPSVHGYGITAARVAEALEAAGALSR